MNATARPFDGMTWYERVTFWSKLFWPLIPTVEVPVEPDVKVTDGVAVIEKSGTTVVNVNVALTECVSEPLAALTMRT